MAFIVAPVPCHDPEHDSMEGAMFWLLAVTCGIAMTAIMVVDELDWDLKPVEPGDKLGMIKHPVFANLLLLKFWQRHRPLHA